MKSKGRAQEMFRSLRGDISLLVVRPPQTATGYEDDLENMLDLAPTLQSQVTHVHSHCHHSCQCLSSVTLVHRLYPGLYFEIRLNNQNVCVRILETQITDDITDNPDILDSIVLNLEPHQTT